MSDAKYTAMDQTKQEPTATVNEYSVEHTPVNMQAPQSNKPWITGFFKHVPWKGLGALVISGLGIIAGVAVLVKSNNDPTTAWPVQPQVYLAIASTITNITLVYALKRALDIAWWTRAIKPGTTVAHLHREWHFGTSVAAALFKGLFRLNFLALACVLVALAPINGPLLQRASKITPGYIFRETKLKIPISEKIPDGYTGYLSGRQGTVSLLTPNFTSVMNEFAVGIPANITVPECKGVCAATIRGAGFSVNCSTDTADFDLSPKLDDSGSLDIGSGVQVFGNHLSWDDNSPSQLQMGVQYKPDEKCAGSLQIRNCTLQAAIVEYPIIIDGNSSTVSLEPGTSYTDDKVIETTEYVGLGQVGPTTLGGLAKAITDLYDSTANLRFIGSLGYELVTQGPTSNRFAIIDPSNPAANCTIYFEDPSIPLVEAARDLMFRTAIYSANGTNAFQTVQATENITLPVFHSNYVYLGLATLFSLLALLMVFPQFLGWWNLGRQVSMSPIETAKAFRAPMLMGSDPNGEKEELVAVTGDRGVMYGAVSPGDGQAEWLGMNQPNVVRRPRRGERFVG